MALAALAAGAIEEMNAEEGFGTTVMSQNSDVHGQQPEVSSGDLTLTYEGNPTSSHEMGGIDTTSSTEITEPNTTLHNHDDSAARHSQRLPKPDGRKGSTNKRRMRNNWTPEGEDTLWTALTEHGSNWARIEQMHGKRGEVDNILKARDKRAIYQKAVYTKKMHMQRNEPVPACLESVRVGKRVQEFESTDSTSGANGRHEDQRGPARRVKRRVRGGAPSANFDAAIKQEAAIVIDDSEGEGRSKDEHALRSVTPKTKSSSEAGRGAEAPVAGADPRLIRLQLEAARRAREEAELEILLYRSQQGR